jgi:hypothetical protein
VLCQLSYCPRFGTGFYRRQRSTLVPVPAPRRRPLGVLFGLLAAIFVALATYAGLAGQWIVAVGAGVLGLWLADLAFRSVR